MSLPSRKAAGVDKKKLAKKKKGIILLKSFFPPADKIIKIEN